MRRPKKTIAVSGDTSFERLVVLINPVSTRSSKAQRYFTELRSLLPDTPVDFITTSPKGRQANATLLCAHADKLGPKTLLCIAAGDGTTSLFIETLVQDRRLSPKARRTPILPLWGGNGNDLAHMLNGSPRSMRRLLEQGQIIAIQPLECRLTAKDGTVTKRIAVCYAGFGLSGVASKSLSEPKNRGNSIDLLPGGHVLRGVVTARAALKGARPFVVEELEARKLIYERAFSNGSKVAKQYRLPVKLTDNYFYLDSWEGRLSVIVFTRLFIPIFKKIPAKNRLRKYDEFVIHTNVWAHFDAEAAQIAAGTKVEVELSTRPFYALSTTLASEGRRGSSLSYPKII